MKSKNSLILLFKCPGPSTLTWHKLPLLCSLPSALQWRGARGRISQNFQVSFQADFFLTFFTKNVPIYWRDIVTILSSRWWRLRKLVKSSVVGPCRCWCYRGWAPVLAPAAWLCSSPSASLSSDSATAPPTPRHTWHVTRVRCSQYQPWQSTSQCPQQIHSSLCWPTADRSLRSDTLQFPRSSLLHLPADGTQCKMLLLVQCLRRAILFWSSALVKWSIVNSLNHMRYIR